MMDKVRIAFEKCDGIECGVEWRSGHNTNRAVPVATLSGVDADQFVSDNVTDFVADLSNNARVKLLDEIGEDACRKHFGIGESSHA